MLENGGCRTFYPMKSNMDYAAQQIRQYSETAARRQKMGLQGDHGNLNVIALFIAHMPHLRSLHGFPSRYGIHPYVLKLPVHYRNAIYLFYYEDYSIQEIAGVLNEKEGTIKTRLRRGREEVKKILTEGTSASARLCILAKATRYSIV